MTLEGNSCKDNNISIFSTFSYFLWFKADVSIYTRSLNCESLSIQESSCVRQCAGRQAARGSTYLEGPAGSMFVIVADSLQLAASCKLPDDTLQAPPQTFTVEEHEELGQRSGEDKKRGIRQMCGAVPCYINVLNLKWLSMKKKQPL